MNGMIGPIFGGIVALAGISWLIFNYIKGRKLAIEALCAVDTTFAVTCTKCKKSYEVAPRDFLKISSFKIQKDEYIKKGFVGSNKVLALQRFCPCPYCKRDELAVFQDVDKVQALDKEVAWPIFIKYAAIGIIPPLLIMKILTKLF